MARRRTGRRRRAPLVGQLLCVCVLAVFAVGVVTSASASASSLAVEPRDADETVNRAVHHIVQRLVDAPLSRLNKYASDGSYQQPDVAVNGDANTHVRLHNDNLIKRTHDVFEDWDSLQEGTLKSNTEEGSKHSQEANNKVKREEHMKLASVFKTKVTLEQRAKSYEQVLKMKTEMSRKRNREFNLKRQQREDDSMNESQAKLEVTKKRQARAQQLQDMKAMKEDESNELRTEVAKEHSWEREQKTAMVKGKLSDDQARKFAKEMELEKDKENSKKTKQEQKVKKQQSDYQDQLVKRNEQWRKATDKVYERDWKQRKATNEEADKADHKTSLGRWCDCMTVAAKLSRNDTWASCPADSLMTGFIRANTDANDLTDIDRFYCCKPCRADRTNLKVGDCVNADWRKSFDSLGWSLCPAHTYMQGVFKSACNKIFCLEYARCCQIKGSRGRTHCKPNKKWTETLPKAGWSVVDDDHFMGGLYRAETNQLNSIEASMQCRYYSYL